MSQSPQLLNCTFLIHLIFLTLNIFTKFVNRNDMACLPHINLLYFSDSIDGVLKTYLNCQFEMFPRSILFVTAYIRLLLDKEFIL